MIEQNGGTTIGATIEGRCWSDRGNKPRWPLKRQPAEETERPSRGDAGGATAGEGAAGGGRDVIKL